MKHLSLGVLAKMYPLVINFYKSQELAVRRLCGTAEKHSTQILSVTVASNLSLNNRSFGFVTLFFIPYSECSFQVFPSLSGQKIHPTLPE